MTTVSESILADDYVGDLHSFLIPAVGIIYRLRARLGYFLDDTRDPNRDNIPELFVLSSMRGMYGQLEDLRYHLRRTDSLHPGSINEIIKNSPYGISETIQYYKCVDLFMNIFSTMHSKETGSDVDCIEDAKREIEVLNSMEKLAHELSNNVIFFPSMKPKNIQKLKNAFNKTTELAEKYDLLPE